MATLETRIATATAAIAAKTADDIVAAEVQKAKAALEAAVAAAAAAEVEATEAARQTELSVARLAKAEAEAAERNSGSSWCATTPLNLLRAPMYLAWETSLSLDLQDAC